MMLRTWNNILGTWNGVLRTWNLSTFPNGKVLDLGLNRQPPNDNSATSGFSPHP